MGDKAILYRYISKPPRAACQGLELHNWCSPLHWPTSTCVLVVSENVCVAPFPCTSRRLIFTTISTNLAVRLEVWVHSPDDCTIDLAQNHQIPNSLKRFARPKHDHHLVVGRNGTHSSHCSDARVPQHQTLTTASKWCNTNMLFRTVCRNCSCATPRRVHQIPLVAGYSLRLVVGVVKKTVKTRAFANRAVGQEAGMAAEMWSPDSHQHAALAPIPRGSR